MTGKQNMTQIKAKRKISVQFNIQVLRIKHSLFFTSLQNKLPINQTQLLLLNPQIQFTLYSMSYAYRSVQPKTNPNNKASEPQPVKQLTKQQLKTYESLLLIIGYVIRSNEKKKIKQAFSKVKSVVAKKKKYSELLVKKIHFLFKHKQREYTQMFFSSLVANRITFYNSQMASHKQLKQNSKNRAVGILFHSLQKLYNKKFVNAFSQLRNKSLAYSKARVFKTTHMFARLSLAYRHKLQGAFNKLAKNRVKVGRNGRIFNKLQNFFSAKNKRNVLAGFNRLRTNLYKAKLGQIEGPAGEAAKIENKTASTKNLRGNTSGITKMQSQRRQLQQKSRQLQAQLTQLQQAAGKNLTALRNQINRLQKDNQSLRFNNDLLDQNNTQLQRDIQSKQLRARKKLSKNEIWQNVYNNLIYFLALNRNKTITKEQLIECLETPLVPCNTNLEELNEENKVLAELLAEYKKSFPEPENSNPEAELTLPYDLLKKKNRYYYQVLEVLSEWGLSGSNELNQLNQDLEALQKKLIE